MTPALEKRDLEERLAVDLQQVERGEDLPSPELPRVRVAVVVDLEVALVLPVGHQDAGEDRVVQLARSVHPAFVAEEMRLGMANAHQHSRARPGWLEDVALPLRSFADEPGSLGQKVCP